MVAGDTCGHINFHTDYNTLHETANENDIFGLFTLNIILSSKQRSCVQFTQIIYMYFVCLFAIVHALQYEYVKFDA